MIFEIESNVPLPKPEYKKFQELYSVCVDDEGKCSLSTYRVRTINKRGVYVILITSYTWGNKAARGKRFSKTQDIGFLDSIPSWCRTSAKNKKSLEERGIWTTKLAAWKDPNILRFLGEEAEDLPIRKKAETQIKAAITRLKVNK